MRDPLGCPPLVIGNLFRSSWESGDLGCSGSGQGGLARESAAVALLGGGLLWLTNGLRPVPAPGEDVAQGRSALPEVALPSSPRSLLGKRRDLTRCSSGWVTLQVSGVLPSGEFDPVVAHTEGHEIPYRGPGQRTYWRLSPGPPEVNGGARRRQDACRDSDPERAHLPGRRRQRRRRAGGLDQCRGAAGRRR
jgi:hypothetical protein